MRSQVNTTVVPPHTNPAPSILFEQGIAIPAGEGAQTQPVVSWLSGQMRIVWVLVLLYAAGLCLFLSHGAHQLRRSVVCPSGGVVRIGKCDRGCH